MKKILTLLLLTIITTSAYGQTFEIPENYSFETAQDCRRYAADVEKIAEWIIETPIDDNLLTESFRLKGIMFIINWMGATPDVTFGLPAWTEEVSDKNIEIGGIIIASMARYAIANNYKIDNAEMQRETLENVIIYYDKNIKFLKKNKKINKYRKLMEEGRLDEIIGDIL